MNSFFERMRDANPYVIAEIGVNHGGDFKKALELIDLAVSGGADAVKFQSYKAERIASRYSPAYWDTSKEPTKSQFELFKKYDSFGEDEYVRLASYCRGKDVDFLSTPFDSGAVDFLEPLMPAYKIASADITNRPFLRQIAGKRKPVLLSTGASTLAEIETALAILDAGGADGVALLHCVLNYPTPNENAHLGMIKGLSRCFPERMIGYSDHTVPDGDMTALVTAYHLGARIIEKHFTYDKTLPGNDHYHAMDMHDLSRFRSFIAKVNELGCAEELKRPLPEEAPARQHARRSIVAARIIEAGERISEEAITYKRPAHGISPLFWDEVIGKTALVRIDEDKPLEWRFLE
jgi:N-acetylneuraminate synthase